MPHDQIDAVITWVDGADPVLAQKRRQYLADPTIPGAAATRFASNDEVLWCTLSILRSAPFFRRLFFVTDNQTPQVSDALRRHFPDQAHKLEVVVHSVTFRGYEEFLPSFNSTRPVLRRGWMGRELELFEAARRGLDRYGAEYIRAHRITPAKCAEKLRRADTDPAVKFLCVQNLDQADPQLHSMITEWLDKRLPGRLDTKEA